MRRVVVRNFAVAAASSIAVFAGSAATASAETVLADNGFRPDPNGFSFPNYGDEVPYQNLTPVEMVKLFGNSVCGDSTKTVIHMPPPAPTTPAGVPINPNPGPPASKPGEEPGDAAADLGSAASPATLTAAGPCKLTPDAQQWMDTQNAGMNQGHCYGFAVLSEQLYKGQFSPFAATPPFSYQIAGDSSLQRSIAYAFVYQSLDSVSKAMIQGITPNQMLDKLIAVLNTPGRETWTLGIYKPDGSDGHAVTPFQVVDLGAGMKGVNVYDNNQPGETRQIVFDTNTNTWSYDARPNPSVPPQLYGGTASSPQLDLSPTTPGEGVQPATFGKAGGALGPSGTAGAAADGRRLDEVQLLGNKHYHAHLVIRDTHGHSVGVANGAIFNKFPGAIVKPSLAFSDFNETQEPTYLIPARAVTITIDGSRLRHHDTESLSDVGDGQSLGIQNLKIGPGQKDVFDLMNGTSHMTFTAAKGASSGSPLLHIGADTSKSDVALVLKMVKIHPGATVHIKIDERKQLITFYATGSRGSATYVLSAVKETRKANIIEGSDIVRLPGAQQVTYSYAK
jgi:hypothetical protein